MRHFSAIEHQNATLVCRWKRGRLIAYQSRANNVSQYPRRMVARIGRLDRRSSARAFAFHDRIC